MDWLKYDEVKTRVSYVDQHENYELISVNNKVTDKHFDDIGGATSTGEFGSILAEIFSPDTAAEFHWARHALLRGRGVWVFSLRVPKIALALAVSATRKQQRDRQPATPDWSTSTRKPSGSSASRSKRRTSRRISRSRTPARGLTTISSRSPAATICCR